MAFSTLLGLFASVDALSLPAHGGGGAGGLGRRGGGSIGSAFAIAAAFAFVTLGVVSASIGPTAHPAP